MVGRQNLEKMNDPFEKLVLDIKDLIDGAVMEIPLCEINHIFLKPNELYRFVVIPGCKACERLAELAKVPGEEK